MANRADLAPHRHIADPVHGRIELTKLETAVVDTPVFQRLRRVAQAMRERGVEPHEAAHFLMQEAVGMIEHETREDRRREWREMLRRLRVTQDEIAERLQIGRSAVSNVVRYGEVPEYWWYLAMEIARERIAALPEEAAS